MKLSIMTCTLIVSLASLGCGRDQEPRTANDFGQEVGEAGAEAGEAAEEAGQDAAREAERAADRLRGQHRYRCETGEEFVVEFGDDGRTAVVEKNNRLYRFQREEGTGRFTSDQGRMWTVNDETATVELEGLPPMRNCQRR